jgi:hypothetical protein
MHNLISTQTRTAQVANGGLLCAIWVTIARAIYNADLLFAVVAISRSNNFSVH